MKMRADSWYDYELCTAEGEKILERIDTAGITQLRRHRLVWSGWDDDDERVRCDGDAGGNENFRIICLGNALELRLFFLSLLWRAAASSLPEFSTITLLNAELEDLRLRVLNENPGPAEDFPIQLFPLITRGTLHNRTPLLERKSLVLADGTEGSEIENVRFYFDGLVTHVNLLRGTKVQDDYLKISLGCSDKIVAFGREFFDSRTFANFEEMAHTVVMEQFVLDKPRSPIASAILALWPLKVG